MHEEHYEYLIGAEARIRVRFSLQRGRVLEFVAQLEWLDGKKWNPVVRYDTAHGFPHCDRYNPVGSTSKHEPLPVSDVGEALTYAIATIKRDWSELCEPFRRKKKRSPKGR